MPVQLGGPVAMMTQLQQHHQQPQALDTIVPSSMPNNVMHPALVTVVHNNSSLGVPPVVSSGMSIAFGHSSTLTNP